MLGPAYHLGRTHKKYIKQLEGQADGLILALANALKTVPSPTAALESIVVVLPQPMRQEIERLIKEIRVGSTLEQAILNMSSRLKSPDIDAALSSLLIGLQVGGNLPHVLETTASTIREMGRLQGVIRTKTADARVQLWVLALFPFGICWAFVLLDPTFFWPLEQTFVGNLVAAVAILLWLVALVTARRVLKVDI
jgi:tight adherence protein B